jgi:hypothetical protein
MMAQTLATLAIELDDYVRKRAKVEGKKYELDVGWLRLQLAARRQPYTVFGIYIKHNQMVRDEQEPCPGYFDAWMKTQTKH